MDMELEGRVPPHSEDAEKSLLGAMMLSREAVMMAVETLVPDDFYSSVHRAIFSAMCALYAAGRPVDLVTMTEELNRTGRMEGIGGLPYLTSLSRSMPSAANAQAYARIVEEKSVLRRMIRACDAISTECYAEEKTVPEILDNAEKQVYNISMKRSSDALVHIKPTLMTTYANIEETYLNKGRIQGVPSGFAELDRLTTGFHGGEFILVGARPSMGKTAFMLNIAQHAAMVARKTVAFFSLEMSREQLGLRLISTECLIDNKKLLTGRLSGEDEWARAAMAVAALSQAKIYIDDDSSLTVADMNAKCRRIKDLGLVIIDYLQLMQSAGGNARNNENRQQIVSDISRSLKIMAKELNVPVICLSQLSRANESRSAGQRRPMLSDLRESGSIEQDADIVMFIYRESYYEDDTENPNIAECIVAKNRHGETGTVMLEWRPEFTTFRNLAYNYDEEDY